MPLLCHPTALLKVSQAGRQPERQLRKRSTKLPGPEEERPGSATRVFTSVNHLGRRGGNLFKTQIQPSRVEQGNLNFGKAAQVIWLQVVPAFRSEKQQSQ